MHVPGVASLGVHCRRTLSSDTIHLANSRQYSPFPNVLDKATKFQALLSTAIYTYWFFLCSLSSPLPNASWGQASLSRSASSPPTKAVEHPRALVRAWVRARERARHILAPPPDSLFPTPRKKKWKAHFFFWLVHAPDVWKVPSLSSHVRVGTSVRWARERLNVKVCLESIRAPAEGEGEKGVFAACPCIQVHTERTRTPSPWARRSRKWCECSRSCFFFVLPTSWAWRRLHGDRRKKKPSKKRLLHHW